MAISDFDETVYQAMRTFPSLFPDRESVMGYMFGAIGGSYKWVNGRLVSDTAKLTDGEAHHKFFAQLDPFTNTIETLKVYADSGEMVERLEEELAYERQLLELRFRNLRLLSKRKPELTSRSRDCVPIMLIVSFSKEHSNIMLVPDDVLPDYLDGCLEYIGHVLHQLYPLKQFKMDRGIFDLLKLQQTKLHGMKK